jgi:hypothetical protein
MTGVSFETLFSEQYGLWSISALPTQSRYVTENGVDEIAVFYGQKLLTMVYQDQCRAYKAIILSSYVAKM